MRKLVTRNRVNGRWNGDTFPHNIVYQSTVIRHIWIAAIYRKVQILPKIVDV